MAKARWVTWSVVAMAGALAAGCRSGSHSGPPVRATVERPRAVARGGTTGSVAESNLMGRADPFVPCVEWRREELPPPPKPRPKLPGQWTEATIIPPLAVGDGHWRRAAGVLWDTMVSAIYERDEVAFVVGVGDTVGTGGEHDRVVAIGRDSLIVRGADGLLRRVPLDKRSRPGWHGMIEQ